jgi:gliding motility-associated-like protein
LIPPDKLIDPTLVSPSTIHLTNTTTYTLTATSTDGCIASKSTIIKIFMALNMPNGFTPNGDNRNDVFRIPPGTTINLEEFSIFGRWGKKVFSTKNVSNGWDGTINGVQQDTGVYVYIIRGANEKGAIFSKGSFVLIR